MTQHNDTNSRAWIGVLLIALGGFFLFRNLDLLPDFIPNYLFGWESILILIGTVMLVSGRPSGFVLLAIGGLFLLPDIFDIPRIDLRDWWPVILIAVGISIFLERSSFGNRFSRNTTDDEHFTDTSVFWGSEKSITSRSLISGKITSVFGGSELNFSSANIKGEEAVIDLFCMFGGNSIIVPREWNVVMEGSVIFGGHSDKRSVPTDIEGPRKTLRIKGFVMFGGNEIRSA